ncbi:ORF6C domain-containing protein [Facklamia languida]
MSNELTVTTEDFLINILETQKQEKAKLEELSIQSTDHERRLKELEYEVPINGSFNNYLTKLRRERIVKLMGGKKSNAYKFEYPEGGQYKTLTNKVFAEAGRRFKNEYNIAFYGELRQHQYENAVKYWSEYEPSDDLMREINQVNSQLKLALAY